MSYSLFYLTLFLLEWTMTKIMSLFFLLDLEGNYYKKCDLTLIEINVICEVPFYFINIILIDKII
jgi:hypothetical protein